MKKTLLAALIAFSAQAAHAEDFDLTDLVPARADSNIAAAQANVTITDNLVIAENDKEGVQVAHYSLIEDDEDGVRMIQVGSGTGILSIGSASYQTYDNLNATLLSKRAAYNRAFLVSKKQLVENMQGSELRCDTLADSTLSGIDSGTESLANIKEESKQACLESVQGSLAGYVTFDVLDNTDDKTVRVSLISTPKTRAQIRGNAGATALTSDPNALFKQVVADVKSGVLPPVGAKVITHAETGEVIVLGYGSAIKRQNSNANIQRKLGDQAKKQSQTLARSALISTLQGSEVYWKGAFDEKQAEFTQQFDYEDPALEDPQQANKLGEERTSFVNQFSASDAYYDVSQGQVPAGVNTRSFNSDDGYWSYSIAVYAPSLEATAKQAARETSRGQSGASQDNTKRINTLGGQNQQSANPKGASGAVSNSGDL